MANPSRTESIKNFLQAKTHKDLADLYNHDMECQVNVAQDGGTRVDQEYKGHSWQAWTDGVQTWKPLRIPYNAMSEPEYEDVPMSYNLAAHAEGIGMTGWDWKSRRSKWVAFDFDAIAGHSDKHTKNLTPDELLKLRETVLGVPWVTLRKSTSGKGLHLYVFLNDVPTDNHTEHAALARAILGKLSALTGYDFESRVDVCGGNMWIWHRKMQGTDGLTLIKRGDSLDQIPINWRDHVKVVTGKRRKISPVYIQDINKEFNKTEDDSESPEDRLFNDMTSQRPKVALDERHKALLKFLLEDNPIGSWWDADHHMLVTHTVQLAQAHDELNLRGIFKTISDGSDLSTQNCFSGSTEVLTQDGPKEIRNLVGRQKLYVWTGYGMEWIEAEIKSFGLQKTVPVRFADGTCYRATKNHMWLYTSNKGVISEERKYTSELTPRTYLPLASRSLSEIDWEGYAHGFVYGDGWSVGGRTTDVAFFGQKTDLISLVSRFGSSTGSQTFNSHENIPVVRGLPFHWKALPENPTREYALGFVLGLASADGFVATNIQIFQSDWFALEEVRKLAIFAGLRAGAVRNYGEGDGFKNGKSSYALSVQTYNLTQEHLLRKDHKEKFQPRHKSQTTTCRVESLEIEEEVFCAVVPHYWNFTLGNGVITSNCFCFPLRNGAWSVRRYGQGVEEADTWTQDVQGYTRCYYNHDPDLKTAARSFGGLESPKGGFIFQEFEVAERVVNALGGSLGDTKDMKVWAAKREATLKPHKDGRLVVELERKDSDQLRGWLPVKDTWVKIVDVKVENPIEQETANFDDIVRHIVGIDQDDQGWVINDGTGWRQEPLIHVQKFLKTQGVDSKAIEIILGQAIHRAWRLVNKPFQPEYPGDRQWNRNAAQFRMIPSLNVDSLNYPTWISILKHCGQGLDKAIEQNGWCRANAILNGADYLKIWVASIFQRPLEPTPYLFLYGPENSGKSILHEALSLLITKGYKRADTALTSQGGFNAELEGAIICVVEETNLSQGGRGFEAHNRIKDWVTAREISIHAKGKTPYHVVNSTHWIQCANNVDFCPVFPGDTRITMTHVDALQLEEMIPKRTLIERLEREAPDFLASILSLELPAAEGRLTIPVITTEEKEETQRGNRSAVQVFLEEKVWYVPGAKTKYADVWMVFQEFLDPGQLAHWTKTKFGRELPDNFPIGRFTGDGQHYIGNLVIRNGEAEAPQPQGVKYIAIKRGEFKFLTQGEGNDH